VGVREFDSSEMARGVHKYDFAAKSRSLRSEPSAAYGCPES
jgi:hypothetical protein